MKIPVMCRRAQIEGKDGIYMVVRVDEEKQVADLMLLNGERFVEERIPFSQISMVKEQVVVTAAI